MTTLYIDGLCEPINPGGVGAIGYIIDGFSSGKMSYGTVFGYGAPDITNNVAEYKACLSGLEWLANQVAEVEVRSDSRLVINQLTGQWNVKDEKMRKWYDEIQKILPRFRKVDFLWIPGKENPADEVVWKAYEQFLDQNPVIAREYKAHWASRTTQAQLQRLGISRKYVGEQTAKRLMTK